MFKIQDDDDDSFDLGDEDFLAAALEVEASQPKVTKKRSSFEISPAESSLHHPDKLRKSSNLSSIDSPTTDKTKQFPTSSSKKFKFKSTKDKSPPVKTSIHNNFCNDAGQVSKSSDSQESIVRSSQLSEELHMDQNTRVRLSAQNIASFLNKDSSNIGNVIKDQSSQHESESSPTVSPVINKLQGSNLIGFNSGESTQNSVESTSPELAIRAKPCSNSPEFEQKLNFTAKSNISGVLKQPSSELDAIKPTGGKGLMSSAIFKISQDSYDSDLDLSLGESPLRKNTPNRLSGLNSTPVAQISSGKVFKAPQIEIKNNMGRENQFTPKLDRCTPSASTNNVIRPAGRTPVATNTVPAQATSNTPRLTESAKGVQPSSQIYSVANANKAKLTSVNNAVDTSSSKVTNTVRSCNPNMKEQHKNTSTTTFSFKNSRTTIVTSQPMTLHNTTVKGSSSTNSPSVLQQGPQRVRAPVTPSPVRQPPQRVVTPISTKQGPRRVKRKFPGPAGILPKLADKTGFDAVVIPSEDRVSPDKNAPVLSQLSQCSEDQFGQGAWSAMTTELGPDSETILANHNIATVLRKASKKQLPRGKVPLLCALIENVEILPNDASVILKDPTGKIKGTIHRDVIKDHQAQLQAGTVLILRQAGVFSPSGRAHYINITPNNLIRMYSKLSDGEINCTSLSELNIADLEKMAENVPESPMPLHSPMIGAGRLGPQNSPQLGTALGTHSRDTALFNTTPYRTPAPGLKSTPQRAIRPVGNTPIQNSSQAMRPPVCVTPAGGSVRNRSVEYGNTTPLQGNIVQRTPRINAATPNVQFSLTPVTNSATARRVNPAMLTPSNNTITTPKQRFNFKPVLAPSPMLFDSPGQPVNTPCSVTAPVFDMKENTPVSMAMESKQPDLWDDSNLDDAVLAGLDEDF